MKLSIIATLRDRRLFGALPVANVMFGPHMTVYSVISFVEQYLRETGLFIP